MQATISDLRSALAASKARCEQLDGQNVGLKAHIAELQATLDASEFGRNSADDAAAATAASAAQLAAQLAALQAAHDGLNKNHAKLSLQVSHCACFRAVAFVILHRFNLSLRG